MTLDLLATQEKKKRGRKPTGKAMSIQLPLRLSADLYSKIKRISYGVPVATLMRRILAQRVEPVAARIDEIEAEIVSSSRLMETASAYDREAIALTVKALKSERLSILADILIDDLDDPPCRSTS